MLSLHRHVVQGTFLTARRTSLAWKPAVEVAFMHGPFRSGNAASSSGMLGATIRTGDHDDIVLPHREYGYRSEPLTWDELVSIVDKEKNLAKLSRSVQQQTEYIIYMRNLKSQWKSIYDHILHNKFGFEKRSVGSSSNNDSDDIQSLWEAHPPVSEIKEPRKTLVLNDFPYYNAPGIYHYVLWKIGGDVTDQEIDEAREELRGSLGDVEDLLHWKNPPHLKSLPDIDHIHILCLRKSTDKVAQT